MIGAARAFILSPRIYEWLLFFHVLAAFCYVAAYAWFTAVIVAGRRTDSPARAAGLFGAVRWGNVLATIGGIGTIALGIWLVIYVDGYEIVDGWIVASLVLWAISVELGRREGKEYNRANTLATELRAQGASASPQLNAALRSRSGLLYHVLGSIAVLAILWLMIYKPGA
jgi:uncharacterized membrane protein